MNKHIESYLKEFITMDKPQYAVMLKGDWGSGKTYFIKNFIENDKNNKYVYVSLFGLKSTEAIDEAIFDELHPVLSSAPVKVLNTVFKSALKLGLRVDVDSENANLNSVNANINLDSVLDYFDKKNKDKNVIFIFDDLERTLLDYTEVLGYINSMVETSGLTVIVIANEDKITNDVFNDFKEKTINKTYKLVSENSEVFLEIVNKHNVLTNHVEGIRNIFDKSGNNNYRVLIQIIDNYKYFSKSILRKFKKNSDFMENLVHQYFIYSFTYKIAGNLDNISDILKSFNNKYQLFNSKTWKDIIENNIINQDELTKTIQELYFFKKEVEKPSWRELWDYNHLNKDAFYKNLKSMQTDFLNFKYNNPLILLHVVSLLITFSKAGIKTVISVEKIRDTTCEYIRSHTNKEWNKKNRGDSFFNSTGLGYTNDDDADFKNILRLINIKIDDIVAEYEVYAEKEDRANSVSMIETGDFLGLIDILDKKYSTVAYLHNLDADMIFQKIMEDDSLIFGFSMVINHRYPSNHTMDNRPISFYRLEELSFLQALSTHIRTYLEKDDRDDFIALKLKILIELLEKNIKYLEEIKKQYINQDI